MRVTLVSLYPLELGTQVRSYRMGGYALPYRKPGERYGFLHIDDANDRERIPDPDKKERDKFTDNPMPGEKIAKCLMQGDDPQNNLARIGFFVTPNETPTEEELAAAEKRQRASFMQIIHITDQKWMTSKDPKSITALERIAAQTLGLEKEWAPKNLDLIACPGCGVQVAPTVAVHSLGLGGCGAILDREKAIALGMMQQASRPADAPARRRRYTRRSPARKAARALVEATA